MSQQQNNIQNIQNTENIVNVKMIKMFILKIRTFSSRTIKK